MVDAVDGRPPAGPRLPANGAPKRIALPALDVWRQSELILNFTEEEDEEEEDEEEDECVMVREEELVMEPGKEKVMVGDATGLGKECGVVGGQECIFCGACTQFKGCEELSCSAHSFHHLLAQIAMEHTRAIEKVHWFYNNHAEPENHHRVPEDKLVAGTPLDRNTPVPSSFEEFATFHVREKETERSGKSTAFSGLNLQDYGTDGRVSPFDLVSESSGVHRSQFNNDLGKRAWHELFWLQPSRHLRSLARVLWRVDTLDFITSTAIVASSLIYGWVADASLAVVRDGGDLDKALHNIEWVTTPFTVWFCFELLLRTYMKGPSELLCGAERAWNWFDILMVCLDLAQTVLESQGTGDSNESSLHMLATMRMIRILRVMRAARVLSLLKTCSKLRVMVQSILHSGSALWWSLMLLAVTIYVFSVYFAQVVAYQLNDPTSFPDHGTREMVEELFHSLLSTLYMLYRCISSGIEWGEVCDAIFQIGFIHGCIFCFYIFFMTIAVLNIITGHFVQMSISSVHHTQEEMAQEQLAITAAWMEQMKKVFACVDSDSSGSISLDEMQEFLQHDEVRAYLDALDIHIDKAKGLFKLLDIDTSGEITVEEFTFGCLRLRGGARSIDMATLMNFVKRMGDQTRRFYQWSENQFKRLHGFEARVDRQLRIFEDSQPSSCKQWSEWTS